MATRQQQDWGINGTPPPAPAPTPPAPAPKPGMTAGDKTARGIIEAYLHGFGLDMLGDWAWKRFKQTGSIDLVKMEMESRPEYKQRFAARLALRDQGIQMTEAEQIAYERSAHDLMKQAGMPPGFYDNWHDFTNIIASGVSVAELSQRVNDAFLKVTSAPPAIRSAMAEYYGAGSDSALAALALDTSKAAPVIMRQIGAAEAGGYLAQQGVHVTRQIAEGLAAATGSQDSAIIQGAQTVGQWNAQGVFDPRFGEAGTALDTGLQAGFSNNQPDLLEIQRQQEQRAASGQGSSTGSAGLGHQQR